MIRKIYSIMLMHFLLFLFCCVEATVEPEEQDPDALKVSGSYNATTFIIPGSNDGSVDVLASGGMITAILYPDYTVSGRVVIPKHTNLRGDGFDETFKGNYTIKHDSLQFKNFQNVLSIPQLYFIVTHNRLEGKLEGISLIIVVLEKQN